MMETMVEVKKVDIDKILKEITGKYTVLAYRKTWLSDNIDKNHDGAIMFSNAKHLLSAGNKTGGIFATGLTEEQERAFEQKMNLKPGLLSSYNKEYWGVPKNWIVIPKDGLKLDCDNVILHKLQYLTLKAQSEGDRPKVSMSLTDADFNGFCEYVVTSDELEAKKVGSDLVIKGKAFDRRSKMNDTQSKDFLKIFQGGKFKTINDTSKEIIDSKVLEIVDKDPAAFLEVMEDPNFQDLVLIEDLLSHKIIKQVGSKLITQENDPLGNTKFDAVANLRSPDFQDLKIALLARLEQITKR